MGFFALSWQSVGEPFFRWLEGMLGSGVLYHGMLGIVIVLSSLLAGKLLKIFLDTIGRKIITQTESDLDDKILEIILDRILAVSAIVGMYFGMRELRSGINLANSNFHRLLDISNEALYVLTIFILAHLASQITNTVVQHILNSLAARHGESNKALFPLVKRVTTIVIGAIALMIVLDHYGQNVASIITLLGAGSVALALAAQDTISNMISGLVIIIDRPFRVGDRIKLPSGEEGDVYQIGLRSTHILDFDHNMLIVPNNELVKTKLINFSYPARQVRAVVDLTVVYGSDVAQVKSILLRCASEHPDVLREPAPEAILVKLSDWGLQFKLLCRVDSYIQQSAVSEKLRILVYQQLAKAGIEMAVPHNLFHMSDSSTHAFHNSSKSRKAPRRDR